MKEDAEEEGSQTNWVFYLGTCEIKEGKQE